MEENQHINQNVELRLSHNRSFFTLEGDERRDISQQCRYPYAAFDLLIKFIDPFANKHSKRQTYSLTIEDTALQILGVEEKTLRHILDLYNSVMGLDMEIDIIELRDHPDHPFGRIAYI